MPVTSGSSTSTNLHVHLSEALLADAAEKMYLQGRQRLSRAMVGQPGQCLQHGCSSDSKSSSLACRGFAAALPNDGPIVLQIPDRLTGYSLLFKFHLQASRGQQVFRRLVKHAQQLYAKLSSLACAPAVELLHGIADVADDCRGCD